MASVALGFSARAAQAQEWTRQSFLLPKGGFELTGEPARPEFMRANLSQNSAFKPIEFPIELFWGVSDDVMIGITHVTGPRFNTGVPHSKLRDNYNDVGFGSVIWLAGGRNYEVDLHAGIPFHSLDPLFIGAQIGVLGRANIAEKVAFVYDPALYFAANHRDDGNGDYFTAPVWFYFQVTPSVAPFVGTGVSGPLNHFSDYFAIPIEGGVLFGVTRDVYLGFDLAFDNALGRHAAFGRDHFDLRHIGFLAQFRF